MTKENIESNDPPGVEDPEDIAARLASNASSIADSKVTDGNEVGPGDDVAQSIGIDARALAHGVLSTREDAQSIQTRPTATSRFLPWRRRTKDPEAEGRNNYVVDSVRGEAVQIGSDNVQVNVYNDTSLASADLARAREVFLRSLKHREEFVGSFLKQALQQANTTFRFSMTFMTAGGIIVLIAGVLALTHANGGVSHPIALVSGLAGLIVGTSGAAFSLKADKARKHLAAQAERMHTQLLDERRFTEVAELLSGIKDANLNDRARVALALRLMGAENEPTWNDSTPSEQNEDDQ